MALHVYERFFKPKSSIARSGLRGRAAMSFPFAAATATMIVAAPFVGCFGANAVRRSLEGKGFLFERSCCDACGRHLELRDLIPVLSWLFQGGRCRACSAPISLLYPAVE